MKYYLSIILLSLAMQLSARYLQTNHLPHFRIATTEKKYVDEKIVHKSNKILIVFFLPDCSDCREFTSKLLLNIKYFKHVKIVLITNANLSILSQFEKDFKLKKYDNIISGTEGHTATFQNEYNIETFPFVVFYNKKTKMINIYRNHKDQESIIEQLKRKK